MVRNLRIHIKERGAVPRKLRKLHTKVSKEAWGSTGKLFHSEMRDKRFTEEHANVARYHKRTDKYTARKQKKFGHTRPLEFTGETRRLVRTANISATSKGSKVKYPGARKLNFRPKGGFIRMNQEFRKLTSAEKSEMGKHFDNELQSGMNADNNTETRAL